MARSGVGAYSAHVDTFCRDNLPPIEQWPDLLLNAPDFNYPERLNAASTFVDDWLKAGHRDRLALRSPDEELTYAALAERINRIANVLVSRFALKPGQRVLLRSPNSPMLVALYFAVIKAGGVVVATMPLLRAKELSYIIAKAKIELAICDHRLLEEMEKTRPLAPTLRTIVPFGGGGRDDLIPATAAASAEFQACPTAADDVCLIGFTSGTTGEPKGTMHFHRDLLAICDAYGKHVLKPTASDVFIGSPPLAFTFGLGGLVLFPFRVGASTYLLEQAPPDKLLAAIRESRPTTVFTAPTAYRAMIAQMKPGDTDSLRTCVSAGETLPKATWEAWKSATGIEILDGIGATELLHIFIGAPKGRVRAGATGLVVPGYRAKVIGAAGEELERGMPGRLAVCGPTGCRYLADDRQKSYVQDGWNITGDTYVQDADGYFWYQARNDDMIISAGYNIAGPEVEASLLSHPAVAECGVVGAPDPERGMVVKAYVVLKPGHAGDSAMAETLQAFVKADIAPYKYPRAIAFVPNLPRTETGKLQRFVLRERAAGEAA